MKVDLNELERVAHEMARWEETNLASDQECMKCGDTMHTPSELEPTPLCDLCAQAVAEDMPALVARIRELESACRCGAYALRIHDPKSPTAVALDEAARGGVL